MSSGIIENTDLYAFREFSSETQVLTLFSYQISNIHFHNGYPNKYLSIKIPKENKSFGYTLIN